MADKPPPPVGHTCIAIDRAQRLITEAARMAEPSVTGAAQVDVLVQARAKLEVVRQENVALRARLAWFEEQHAILEADLTGGHM